MWMDFSTIQLHHSKQLKAADCYRYFLVLAGQGNFTGGGHILSLSRHDIFTLSKDKEAGFESEDGGTILLGSIGIHDFKAPPQDMIVLPAETTGLVRQIFYMALDTQGSTLPYYDSVNAAIHQLMFSALVACGIQSTAVNPKVFEVIRDINDHFTEPDYDTRSAVRNTGYTDNHFRKLFQQETGSTPAGYLTNRRLDRAVELLDQFKGRISIKEISLQCGYQDPYYFSRQFKKRFGVSPQNYINNQ